MKFILWIGIALCVTQGAIFAGLNLAVFSIGRLRLEIESTGGDPHARTVLGLRKNSNFTLATIIWGNVAANVLLTLLSREILAGVLGFVFSTVVITCLGEIAPQAYFSRHALRTAACLAPLLKGYGVILYPVAKPTALLLDWWLGPEAIAYLRERDFRALITQHVKAATPEVGALEGTGALNFLDLDDIALAEEGAVLDPRSIIELPIVGGRPVIPPPQGSGGERDDPFVQRVNASGKRWIVITDPAGQPAAVLDAHRFLRSALLTTGESPAQFLHQPIVATDARTPLGNVLGRLTLRAGATSDDVIDGDVILLWGRNKRIITGADLLGRLLRGIAQRPPEQR